ncbi:PilZ domain-containing protein [Thalassotalea euphylliae]|uniref:Flagellar brake protein n=1 Tax=Thalassotalea euphylliae TaxID=1655234 RepID=A0A3E0UFQ0_9GAMM|nr:PilZ domain-containing protein [Thalassotalea euphylliae]REL34592.1 flagellar brake protein [Thalassotalea euphylliae]
MAEPIKIDVAKRLNRNLGLFNAGSQVTIDIVSPAGKRGKFRTTFVGYLTKQYVLIQYPESNKLGGFAQYITQGTNITVRGVIEGHEGSIVAFVSPVRQTLQIPSRLMVLEFPKTLSLQNLRSSMRIETDIKAKVKVNNDYWQAKVQDMSSKGCQLSLHNGDSLLLNKEQDILIVIEDFQEKSNIKLDAVICNVKTQVDGIAVGVQFKEQGSKQVIELLNAALTVEL